MFVFCLPHDFVATYSTLRCSSLPPPRPLSPCYALGRLKAKLYFTDTRKGLCFAVVTNNMCEAVTKEMMQVRKKECCCTAGKAWGTDCQLCPRRGTGNYRPSSALIFVIFHFVNFVFRFANWKYFSFFHSGVC